MQKKQPITFLNIFYIGIEPLQHFLKIFQAFQSFNTVNLFQLKSNVYH